MPFALSWTRDRRVVTVRHFGTVTVDEIQASLDEIARHVDPANLPAMLVNHRRVERYPGQPELMFFARRNASQPRVSTKTAFVVNDTTAEVIEFVVLAASNRGFLVRAFTDEAEAVQWLLEPA